MSLTKKAGYFTLGCKLNFSETSTIARQLEEVGIVRADRGEEADIYIINSCSVTENADKKCRNLVRRITKQHPSAVVAVTGCYAQLKPQEIGAIEGVDLVIGNNDKHHLSELVREIGKKGKAAIYTCDSEELTSFFSSFSSGDRTRTFLKVQDGCDYKCSYCTIPLARGRSRNTPIVDVVADAKTIATKGQKEIVITGINTGDFGKTTGERFVDLLCALEEVDGIHRYRISSIEPNLLTDEVIDFCRRSQKFQPHFHIPLQSGSDRILELMRRRYTTSIFGNRIQSARNKIGDVFLGIDVIVGFPGETDHDFESSYCFLENIAPAYLHIFPYSVRKNTPAADLDEKVPTRIIEKRIKRLTALSDNLHTAYVKRYLGEEMDVLFESTKKGGLMFGYTPNYIRVEAPYDRSLINQIVKVRLGKMNGDHSVVGTIING